MKNEKDFIDKIKESCGKGVSEIIDDVDKSLKTKGGKVFLDLCVATKDILFESLDEVKNYLKSKLTVEKEDENIKDDKEENK